MNIKVMSRDHAIEIHGTPIMIQPEACSPPFDMQRKPAGVGERLAVTAKTIANASYHVVSQ